MANGSADDWYGRSTPEDNASYWGPRVENDIANYGAETAGSLWSGGQNAQSDLAAKMAWDYQVSGDGNMFKMGK